MNLPHPSADALAQSRALHGLICARIDQAGGWLSFARYMELALYAPGLGYYSAGAQKFGPAGDFITAPELTPLFGQALAVQLGQVMAGSAPQLIEVGAGTGLLAADVLRALEARGELPERYAILELSADLRARQHATLAAAVPHLLSRVRWLERSPEHFSGGVVANEVLDVMPQHLISVRAGGVYERGVGCTADGELHWVERPATGAVLAAAQALDVPTPVEGAYLTEINLAARAWVRDWAARLERGALLMIDYGYPRAEYYLPSRSHGTLLCYYRHRAHADPLLWPGLNDITAFVDFTSVAEAAFDAGLDVLGYTSQASFLFNCGILSLLATRAPEGSADYVRAARAVQRLTTPQEMGELFKVLAVGRGLDAPLLGFHRGDRLHAL